MSDLKTAATLALDALEQWNTPLYKRANVIESLRKAIAEAEKQEQGEIERLTAALKKANEQAEHFERKWYLLGDELEKLKQEQGEPVAWMMHNSSGDEISITESNLRHHQPAFVQDLWKNATPLYTTPQPAQKPWVGIDDEEIRQADHRMVEGAYHHSFKQGVRWAEDKLKERNT